MTPTSAGKKADLMLGEAPAYHHAWAYYTATCTLSLIYTKAKGFRSGGDSWISNVRSRIQELQRGLGFGLCFTTVHARSSSFPVAENDIGGINLDQWTGDSTSIFFMQNLISKINLENFRFFVVQA